MGAQLIRCSDEVQAALRDGRPVVALETSIWCQGLPYPTSIEGARQVDAVVRAAGAVPAVLGLDQGEIRVGIDLEELDGWCRSRDALKAGARDLGLVLAQGKRAATTVSACLAICARVGIGVLATGGIGGVHRGASETYDVSNDLQLLASSGVCVVSSGIKSILDVPATLEMLETLGVPVLGYGVDSLPVFYSRSSPYPVMARLDSVEQVAEVVRAHRACGMSTGLMLANPVPAEAEIAREVVERWTCEALVDAAAHGVQGKAVTPHLLAYLHRVSEGLSLRANLALITSNAELAARLAARLAQPC